MTIYDFVTESGKSNAAGRLFLPFAHTESIFSRVNLSISMI